MTGADDETGAKSETQARQAVVPLPRGATGGVVPLRAWTITAYSNPGTLSRPPTFLGGSEIS